MLNSKGNPYYYKEENLKKEDLSTGEHIDIYYLVRSHRSSPS